MIVVADAGPLIHLAAIGHMDLIRVVAAEVLIPPAVFHEVVVVGAGLRVPRRSGPRPGSRWLNPEGRT